MCGGLPFQLQPGIAAGAARVCWVPLQGSCELDCDMWAAGLATPPGAHIVLMIPSFRYRLSSRSSVRAMATSVHHAEVTASQPAVDAYDRAIAGVRVSRLFCVGACENPLAHPREETERASVCVCVWCVLFALLSQWVRHHVCCSHACMGRQYLQLTGDPGADMTAAVTQDPTFVAGHAALAMMMMLSNRPASHPAVQYHAKAALEHSSKGPSIRAHTLVVVVAVERTRALLFLVPVLCCLCLAPTPVDSHVLSPPPALAHARVCCLWRGLTVMGLRIGMYATTSRHQRPGETLRGCSSEVVQRRCDWRDRCS